MPTDLALQTGPAEAARAVARDLRAAQAWCNFTLYAPRWLPDDVTITEQSLRPERPDQTATYRYVACGQRRALTLKQFLFDFAPPAYDHPSLWRNPRKTAAQTFPAPRPFPLGDHTVWLGHDHRQFVAGTVGFRRTRLELTVTAGVFSDAELLGVFRGLQVVDPERADALAQTPFATLSHQARHPATASGVPVSYWQHTRTPGELHWTLDAHADTFSRFGVAPPDLSRVGCTLDSVFAIGPDTDRCSEIDFVFEHTARNGAYLRLLVSPEHAPSPIPLNPDIGTQACATKVVAVAGQAVHIAWLTDTYGPFDAAFSYRGRPALLLAQSAGWTGTDWFQSVLACVLEAP
ncbi:MAG: hypothetical protein AAGA11_11525 [Pseudomonadota bacterium]